MIKQHPLGYLGMNQDTSKSKTKGGFYFSAKNIRIKATDKSSSFGLTNQKGNEVLLSIPEVTIQSNKTRFQYTNVDFDQTLGNKLLQYTKPVNATPGCEVERNYLPGGSGVATSGAQVIVGATDIRGGAILVTTDGLGWDCFWELLGVDSGDYSLTLLYCNNLDLSTEDQVQILYNYENSIIEKVYLCDGKHQLRFFNMRQSVANGDLKNLADLEASAINNVSKYDLSQPQIVSSDGGGVHTAGMIQYGYNLYILNGSQTTISPLSTIKSIDKGGNLGGGSLNEQINRSMLVNINNIDQTYTHIRIYAIKYTSYNQIPSVSLIADREIDNFESMSYYDDGNIIETITPEEFLFLGSDPIIPQHIQSKDSRLFTLGIKEETFDIDIDARCYGHNSVGEVSVWENVKIVDNDLTGNTASVNTTTYALPIKHDAINRDYNEYRFTKDGIVSNDQSSQESSNIFVHPGLANATGNITMTIAGDTYLIPIVAGDTNLIVCSKMRAFIEANVSGHSIAMGVVQNVYVLTLIRLSAGNVADTTCPDQLGITFTIENQDGLDSSESLGAQGLYFRLNLLQTVIPTDQASELRFLKDREIYRFGIIFYNNLGQESTPKWLCDMLTPRGNLQGKYNQVSIDVLPAFYTWLNSQTFKDGEAPVGYKLVRADRTLADRTVLTQGIINPMINNVPGNNPDTTYGDQVAYDPATTKMPSVVRTFDNVWPFAACVNHRPLQHNIYGNVSGFNGTKEEFRASPAGNMVSNSFQMLNMMQMFSPELTFENVSIDSSYKLRIIGMVKESDIQNWGKEFNVQNLEVRSEAKFDGGINNSTPGVNTYALIGGPNNLYDKGFFGPTNSAGCIHVNQMYREFKGGFIKAPVENIYEMYGTPEVAQLGINGKSYNNDDKYKYNNNYTGFRVDIFSQDSTNDGASQGIFGEQSNGAQCITFVEGGDNRNADPNERRSITDFYSESGIDHPQGLLMGEFIRDDNYKYIGNLYGGMTYETKLSTDYIPIGEYNDISINNHVVESPGDTHIGDFRFQKLSKTGADLNTTSYNQTTEIVSYITETTVDLKNRADKSSGGWETTWQADYNEYQNYNRVYSQQANLISTTDPGFKFKEVQEFDTRVLSSKLKSPGEAIDSWSDPLVNEVLDLDGKYGPITASVSFRDEIFALQESGISKLSINPRAQTITSDGLGLELGVGGILNDYVYLSTEYGTFNQWSVQATDNGFYFFDVDNASLLRFDGQSLQNISNAAGMHSFFQNNINRVDLLLDNPVNGKGISSGYDVANGDVYMTFLQDKQKPIGAFSRSDDADNYTICWNEETNSFVSFNGFTPAFYFPQGSKFLTTGPAGNDLWSQDIKGSNTFYGTRFDSTINFTVAPNSYRPSVFNNLTYNMQVKDQDGNDVKNATFDKVRLSNDYQDSFFKNVILRKNAKRRDRLWNITLPREYNTRNRIKSPWCTLELLINNNENYEVIVHDLIVSYTEY